MLDRLGGECLVGIELTDAVARWDLRPKEADSRRMTGLPSFSSPGEPASCASDVLLELSGMDVC